MGHRKTSQGDLDLDLQSSSGGSYITVSRYMSKLAWRNHQVRRSAANVSATGNTALKEHSVAAQDCTEPRNRALDFTNLDSQLLLAI